EQIMTVLLTNNAKTELAAGITAGFGFLDVAVGTGALFPSPSGGDWFPVTLEDAEGNIEVCRCTSRAEDRLFIERGQEGTTAQGWLEGTTVSLRLTDETLGQYLQTETLSSTAPNEGASLVKYQ